MSAATDMWLRHHGPVTAAQLASVAGLLADGSRAAICVALLDGRAWTVGELARHAGVAPSTASEHVARLVDGGLLAAVQQGRHRYVRLAGPRTAQLIEDLVSLSVPATTLARRSLRAVSTADALARARTCYDHLAGRLGVRIADALTDSGLLEQEAGFALTEAGLAWSELSGTSKPRPRTRQPLPIEGAKWMCLTLESARAARTSTMTRTAPAPTRLERAAATHQKLPATGNR